MPTAELDSMGRFSPISGVPSDASDLPILHGPNNPLTLEAPSGAGAYSYLHSYEGVGNRLVKTLDGQPTTYVYGRMNKIASQQQFPDTLTDFVYDLDGNLLVTNEGSGLSTYTYDGAGRLHTTQSGGVLSTCTYDFDGWLRWRDTTGSDSSNFIYDSKFGTNVYQEYDLQTGALNFQYTMTPDDTEIGRLVSQRLAGVASSSGSISRATPGC